MVLDGLMGVFNVFVVVMLGGFDVLEDSVGDAVFEVVKSDGCAAQPESSRTTVSNPKMIPLLIHRLCIGTYYGCVVRWSSCGCVIVLMGVVNRYLELHNTL